MIYIILTCICNLDPIAPHLCIALLGLTGVHIFVLSLKALIYRLMVPIALLGLTGVHVFVLSLKVLIYRLMIPIALLGLTGVHVFFLSLKALNYRLMVPRYEMVVMKTNNPCIEQK